MSNIDKKELHNLFNGLKQGKQEAAQELYKKYKNIVYGIAFSMLKNKDDSEDVVQNTFKRIIETDVDKLPKDYEATWMYTVTKNETLQFLQKKDNNINIEDIYNIQDNNDEIAKIIDSGVYNKMVSPLSNKEKEIISLKIIGGLSFTQIGKLLGENTNTTKWRYYNSIYKLKVVLSNISMAIISFIVGVVAFKKTKTTDEITIINNSTNDTCSSEYNSENSYSKGTREDMQNRINEELNWDMEYADYNTKNYINEVNEVNDIVQVEDETKQEPEYNYLSYGFISFSIILLFVAIIIIIKNQLNTRKKPSK